MGGKNIAAAIRKIHKKSKANEPVFDPDVLPAGSIIAVDLSTILVPFVKSDAGAAQSTSIPIQSCTCVQDKLEIMYLKKVKPRKWRLVLVVDGAFAFKDQVVRHKRNQTKEAAARTLHAIREGVYDPAVIRKLRRAEKGSVGVTCDVIANAVKWAQKRPGLTTVSGFLFYLNITHNIIHTHHCRAGIWQSLRG